jgi:hypothetical protein
MDNYGRKALGHLPRLEVAGMIDPVVQVIEESSGEIIYTIRIKGTTFTPKVFADGRHTVRIGEPGTAKMKELKGLTISAGEESIEVGF